MAAGVPLPNERDIVRRYGLTLARYVEFLDSQGGVCRVCRKPPRDDKPLVVDHDHDPPRRIWGLVHGSPCNRALTQDVRRYVREPPDVEVYVADELEVAAIAKRERAKVAARDRRAAATAVTSSFAERWREMTGPTAAAIDALERETDDYRAKTDAALAATVPPVAGRTEPPPPTPAMEPEPEPETGWRRLRRGLRLGV